MTFPSISHRMRTTNLIRRLTVINCNYTNLYSARAAIGLWLESAYSFSYYEMLQGPRRVATGCTSDESLHAHGGIPATHAGVPRPARTHSMK